jgi:hypothetical protein
LNHALLVLPEKHDVISWLSFHFWQRISEVQRAGAKVALLSSNAKPLVHGVYFPASNLIATHILFGSQIMEHEIQHMKQHMSGKLRLFFQNEKPLFQSPCQSVITRNYFELDALAIQMKTFQQWLPEFEKRCLNESNQGALLAYFQKKPSFLSSFIEYVSQSFMNIENSSCPTSIRNSAHTLRLYALPPLEDSFETLIDVIALCEQNQTRSDSSSRESHAHGNMSILKSKLSILKSIFRSSEERIQKSVESLTPKIP